MYVHSPASEIGNIMCEQNEKKKKIHVLLNTAPVSIPHNPLLVFYDQTKPISDNIDFKEKLIAAVKKEVKQVMEEAVTKKYIHEESGSVTSLCAAVEACLSQGLRRRALGLFKTSSTTALLHKVAKVSSQKVFAESERERYIESF